MTNDAQDLFESSWHIHIMLCIYPISIYKVKNHFMLEPCTRIQSYVSILMLCYHVLFTMYIMYEVLVHQSHAKYYIKQVP